MPPMPAQILTSTANCILTYWVGNDNLWHSKWGRGVAVNMPPCQGGDRGFESRRSRLV